MPTWQNDRRPGPMDAYGNRHGEAFRARCADGVIRTATVTAYDADSMGTIPARVTVRGRTVTGHVYVRPTVADYATGAEWPETDPLYRFSANAYGRNAGLLRAE